MMIIRRTLLSVGDTTSSHSHTSVNRRGVEFWKVRRCLLLAAIAAVFVWPLTGCETEKAPPKADSSHDHDHHHAHGPNDGELIELAAPAAAPKRGAEWIHDDDHGEVTVIILDDKEKEEVKIKPESIVIEVKLANKDPQTYTLAPKEKGDDGASRFSIENPKLLTSLKLKDAVQATLRFTVDGAEYFGMMEYVDHSGHHH